MAVGSRSEGLNARRSQRLLLRVPVHIECNQGRLAADTGTIAISAHGALVRLPWEVPLGHEVKVENLATHELQDATVAFVGALEDGKFDVGVDFSRANPKFWGVSFPPADWTPSSRR